MTIQKALEQIKELKDLCGTSATSSSWAAPWPWGMPRTLHPCRRGGYLPDAPGQRPLQGSRRDYGDQFPMGTLEKLGLLKMDFLGLKP